MSVTAPPRPPRPGRSKEPLDREEVEALVEALIEEVRQETRRRRRKLWAVAALVAFAGVSVLILLDGGAASQTASPAVSARMNAAAQAGTSKIAYISELGLGGGYCGTVHVMNPDGSDQRRLTNGGVPGCSQEHQGSWSPDGRKIAFETNVAGNQAGIVVFNADGSGEQRLGPGHFPSWSPKGTQLAFWADAGMYVVSADGVGQRRLVTHRGFGFPAWSPDGRKIAFVANAAPGRHNQEIYVVNADGGGQRRLTRNTWDDSDPLWSPDGRKIAFVNSWQIWVMNADGTGQRRLTRRGASNFNPAWSPDGTRIAFERGRRQRNYVNCSYCAGLPGLGVFVMNADGSGQRKLRQGGSQPQWSPDGRKIAFVSKRNGDSDIYVMNADGSGPRNLTRGTGNRESQPVWSPAQR